MILSQVIEYALSTHGQFSQNDGFPHIYPGLGVVLSNILFLKEKRTFETTWIRSSQMKTQIND